MNWVILVWSVGGGACLTVALIHFLAWTQNRSLRASLAFSVAAISVGECAAFELSMMLASSPERINMDLRLASIPIFFMHAGLIAYVWLDFRSGTGWLAVSSIALRFASVILAFTTGGSDIYREILGLGSVEFLGQSVTVVTEAIRNPWVHVNELSSVLWIIFMVDASVRLWRRGGAENRRRARVVGGSIIFFLVFAAGLASLQDNQIVQIPYFVSLSFLPMILVVSYELGRNITQIAGLAENLRESEAALSLAAESAGAGLWAVNSEGKFLWLTERTRQLYGLSTPDLPGLEDLKAIWHPEDREYLHAALMNSLTDGQEFKEEHRVLDRDGTTRWISSRGRTYPGEGGEPNRLMGASIDITVRKRVEEEVLRHNGELAHMSRVSLAGELSGALVHELGQPLGAVLANSETAQLLLRSPEPDREELNSILVDIQDDSVRAGQIIHDMRTFLKQQVVAFDPIDLQQLFSEVEKLATPDATLRGSKLIFNVSPGLPPVLGHRVQLQQVVLNLILNGLQSMEDSASDERVLRLETDLLESGGLHIMVEDRGRGLPDSSLDEVFTPFLTTKPNGLGMGLAICRRIIHSHGGKIWIENNEHAGATSHIHLPVSAESQGFSS